MLHVAADRTGPSSRTIHSVADATQGNRSEPGEPAETMSGSGKGSEFQEQGSETGLKLE